MFKNPGNRNLEHPVIRYIIHLLTYLNAVGSEIEFCWIPGHVGIPGNENADRTAKHFVDNELYEIKIPFSDFKHCIGKYVNSLFQTTWNNCFANKLHDINETFLPIAKMYSDIRREDIILTRLRIGHSKLTH